MTTTTTTAAPALQKFFIYAPDKTEPGTFEKRLSVRGAHLEVAKKLVASGTIRMCTASNLSLGTDSLFY